MRLAILLPQKGRRRPEHPQTASQTTSTRIFERPDGPLTAPVIRRSATNNRTLQSAGGFGTTRILDRATSGDTIVS